MEIIEEKNHIKINSKRYEFGELLVKFLNSSTNYFQVLLDRVSKEDVDKILHKLALNIKHSNHPVIIETSDLKEITIEQELEKILQKFEPTDLTILESFIRSIGNNEYDNFKKCFIHDLENIQNYFNTAITEIFSNQSSNIKTLIGNYDKTHSFDNILKTFKYATRTSYKYKKSNKTLEKHMIFYDFDSFIFYDFINLVNYKRHKDNVFIKSCRNCNMLFLAYKSDIAYCEQHRNLAENRHYPYEQKVKTDVHYREYNKAYSRIYKQYVRSKYKDGDKLLDNWRAKAKNNLDRYKKNEISDKEYFNFFAKENSPFLNTANRKKYL